MLETCLLEFVRGGRRCIKRAREGVALEVSVVLGVQVLGDCAHDDPALGTDEDGCFPPLVALLSPTPVEEDAGTAEREEEDGEEGGRRRVLGHHRLTTVRALGLVSTFLERHDLLVPDNDGMVGYDDGGEARGAPV